MAVVKLDEKLPAWAQQAIAKLEKLAARLASYSNPAAHMECDRIAALIRQNAALSAQGAEPVAWQYRTRKVLSDGWHEWQNCGKELADEIAEGGSFGGRPAEARALSPGGVGDAVTEVEVDRALEAYYAPHGMAQFDEVQRACKRTAMRAALAARTGKGES